jgi:hypothetical protein
LTTEKIAVFAPIPMASAASAARVKPGLLRSIRRECRASLKRSVMDILQPPAAPWVFT